MFVFISVNYGTCELIQGWVKNVRSFVPDAYFIIVDNFKSQDERLMVRELSRELSFILLEADNIGYGRALNLAISYAKKQLSSSEKIFFAGNLDIKYSSIPMDFPSGKYVYQPRAYEGLRNRNPFLTRLQKKWLFLHFFTLKTNSPYALLFVTSCLKILGFIKSKVWTVHGSLFCFNEQCLYDENIFNEKSFLYSEELEFGSYMEMNKCEFISSPLEYYHEAHVATSGLICSKEKFIEIWRPSFINWMGRWK